MSSVVGREEVERALPHRDPFLFVDRVVEVGADWLASSWSVPADADWFRGHYPGEPVLPGVLICEHVFQSGALLARRLMEAAGEELRGVPVLTKIGQARFRRIVRPGETLETRVQLDERVGPAFLFTGDVRCDGQRVLRIEFTTTSTGGAAAMGI